MHRFPRSALHLADPLQPECGGLLFDAAPEEHGPEATLNVDWGNVYFLLRYQFFHEDDDEDQIE